MVNGTISSLQIAPAGKAAMQLVKEVHTVPEKGLEDDRYFCGRGTHSPGGWTQPTKSR
jgi:hypothetical protein